MKDSCFVSKILLCLALIAPVTTACQNRDTSLMQEIDTLNMLLKAKIQLIQFMNNIEKDSDICLFLSKPINYKIINSRGFAKHLIFFEVKISWDENSDFQFIYEEILTFSYNNKNKKIYCLKGFKDNDFKIFFYDLKFSNIDYLIAGEEDLKSKKKFVAAFSVSGLDLGCLFDSMKKRRNLLPCEKSIEPFIRR